MESGCAEAFQDNRKSFFFLFNVILLPPPFSLALSGGRKGPVISKAFFSLEDLFERAASEQRFPGRIKVQEQKASEGCFTAEAAVAYLLSE